MKTKTTWFAAICLLPLPLVAQSPDVITMDQEPHHHLALHNEYVKVFKVEASPGDSTFCIATIRIRSLLRSAISW